LICKNIIDRYNERPRGDFGFIYKGANNVDQKAFPQKSQSAVKLNH
jgi:hypothetical protein